MTTPVEVLRLGDESLEMLVLGADGLWIYGEDGAPIEVEEQVYAVGSGASWALASLRTQAALGCDADVALALRISCELDSHSALPMVEVRLGRGSSV